MEFMNVCLLLLFVLFSEKIYLIRSLQSEKMEIETKLKVINKPAIKSFQTETGDILDCVEIDKQLAFDHPKLNNHSIQIKPSRNILKLGRPSSRLKALQFFPKNINCPEGTVLIKRVRIEEIVMEKFSSLNLSIPKFTHKEANDIISPGHQEAVLSMTADNVGIRGNLNVWSADEVTPDQSTFSKIYVANGSDNSENGIVVGWFVHPFRFGNLTRMFIYGSTDDGAGCYNIQCPGFVQVSRKIPVGIVIYPLSTYNGQQYEIDLTIIQDDTTGNWWVRFFDENVGYYPKELFTSLASGAAWVGWGGEIYSPIVESYPPMGSGHFPDEGFGKAAFISQMKLLDPSHQVILPNATTLVSYVSMEKCYRLLYPGDRSGEDITHTMYFGGPPNCTVFGD